MGNSNLSEIREELVLELHSMAAEGSSSADIIKRFTSKNSHLIRDAAEELIQIALMKILNQVRGRKTPVSTIIGHPDLFLSTYDGPRIFSVPARGSAERLNIKLKDMTCDQLSEWCVEHGKRREKEDKELKEAQRMLEEVNAFRVSSKTTVEEALQAAQLARQSEDLDVAAK